MQPAVEIRRVRELHAQLDLALRSQDWDAVSRADLAIRQYLQAQAGRNDLATDVTEARRWLKALHDRAMQACADECERLRRLMLNHLEYAEGRSAYMQVEAYLGGQ
ncbi:hypothetical protein [Metapseudomonas resinovorans]|uniref:Flagellar protein FliT n=1 Tax=Metapseudomonas resinovorans NBRC 106553 TaxID=1245471 RepID=S6AYP9_METRE|nr:hypothetical protein [Pseudomonas resinovorans]BAN49936.1 hypothetical protein PCA10_42040 [Pseudomonas resinovorans NBRC 106553]